MADMTGTHQWRGADAYEAYMGRWSRPAAGAALAWLQPLPGRTWLDVGCGTGALTQAILDTANPQQILAVDPSTEFLATAADQISDSRVRFAVGDARALPTPSDRFDVVIAGLVLHLLPDPQPAIAEMARAARRGGQVAAYIWDLSNAAHFTGYLWQAATARDPAAAELDPRNRTTICHPESLAALFTSAGLHEVAVEAIVMPAVFRDFDDYWQPHLLAASSPGQRYVASLAPEERAALREQLRGSLPTASDGTIPLHGYLWAVRGMK